MRNRYTRSAYFYECAWPAVAGNGGTPFEEGSTGRKLFVLLDGLVQIGDISRARKTVIIMRALRRDGRHRPFLALSGRDRFCAEHWGDADQSYSVGLSGQSAPDLMITDALTKRLWKSDHVTYSMSDRKPPSHVAVK